MKNKLSITSSLLIISLILACDTESEQVNLIQSSETVTQEKSENSDRKLLSSKSARPGNIRMDDAIRIDGRLTHIDGNEKAVFMMNGQIVVIDSNGIAFAFPFGESIGNGTQISTIPIGVDGIPARYIFPIRDYIVVINEEREVWLIDTTQEGMGYAFMIPSLPIQQISTRKKYDRFIFPIGNRFIMVNSKGAVYASDFSEDNRLGEPYRVWGTPVAFYEGNSIRTRAVFASGESIIVLNEKGEVWALDMTSKNTNGRSYLLNGEKGPDVALYGVPARHFLIHNDQFLVINDRGEVWAHQIHREELN